MFAVASVWTQNTITMRPSWDNTTIQAAIDADTGVEILVYYFPGELDVNQALNSHYIL